MPRPSQTKIVATLGPATKSADAVRELVQAGVDVFRINTAHGTLDEHQARVDLIRAISGELEQPLGVLVDLPGPKIRLGEIPGGSLECAPGDTLWFVRGDASTEPCRLTSTYETLVDELDVGDRVLLVDGLVACQVEKKTGDAAQCRVLQGGTLRSRQGINLPGVRLKTSALSDDDRRKARWAAEAAADYLGLSFVRTADDIGQLRELLAAVRTPHESSPSIIAKIEKPEAVAALEAIVEAADGVMVARGDLGVEIDIAELPMVQKQIVALCRLRRKPVIIATQMLESMQSSPMPTRAEATDVANAILDGADACMLSGETAVGRYPRHAVEMMHRIALATEDRRPGIAELPPLAAGDRESSLAALTAAAGRLAEQVAAKAVVAVTASGRTALHLAKARLGLPTLAVSDSQAVLQRMCLYWGVIPLHHRLPALAEEVAAHIIQRGLQAGWFAVGDRLVFVFGPRATQRGHGGCFVYSVGD